MTPIFRRSILGMLLVAVSAMWCLKLAVHSARHPVFGTRTSLIEGRTSLDSLAAFLKGSLPDTHGRPLSACAILRAAGTVYVLEKDVTAAATCFGIQADHITLNLNGHTITYGAGKPLGAVFGVLGIACWDTTLQNGVANGNPCGGSFDHLTVLNGKIVQADGGPAYSDAIHLGQGGGNYLQVHDVEFSVQGDAAIPIFTTFSGSGSTIYQNVIHNRVRRIPNRHQLQGMSIKFANSQLLRPGQSVHDNRILGGAQGGIFLATRGARAYGNDIRQDSYYSNDFSIYMWGNDQEVFKNNIDVISGRGIQIGGGAVETGGPGKGGARSVAHDNQVRVRELKRNCDYSEQDACNVCQPGGSYGIQFDDNPQGDQSQHNTVVAEATECDAVALKVTDSRLRENESNDDSFTATRVGQSSANAYGWDNTGPTGFTARNDTFIADTASFHVNWDGAQNEICIACTFGKGTNASSRYATFSFQNGGTLPVKNIHFVDPKFVGGAARDSTDMRPIDPTNWPGPSEYFIDWTFRLQVDDQHGSGVAGAAVSLADALGNIAYEGKTGADGKLAIPLNEFRMYNTPTRVVRELHTPYTVDIRKTGCMVPGPKFSVEIKEPTSRTVRVTCDSR